MLEINLSSLTTLQPLMLSILSCVFLFRPNHTCPSISKTFPLWRWVSFNERTSTLIDYSSAEVKHVHVGCVCMMILMRSDTPFSQLSQSTCCGSSELLSLNIHFVFRRLPEPQPWVAPLSSLPSVSSLFLSMFSGYNNLLSCSKASVFQWRLDNFPASFRWCV